MQEIMQWCFREGAPRRILDPLDLVLLHRPWRKYERAVGLA
jgi:hypothetical protein